MSKSFVRGGGVMGRTHLHCTAQRVEKKTNVMEFDLPLNGGGEGLLEGERFTLTITYILDMPLI